MATHPMEQNNGGMGPSWNGLRGILRRALTLWNGLFTTRMGESTGPSGRRYIGNVQGARAEPGSSLMLDLDRANLKDLSVVREYT